MEKAWLASRLEMEKAWLRWKARRVVSPRLAKRRVFAGKRPMTNGRLRTFDLVKNKRGKVVSRKMSELAERNPWILACSLAKRALNIKSFCLVKRGTPLYDKAKWLHAGFLYNKAKSIHAAYMKRFER